MGNRLATGLLVASLILLIACPAHAEDESKDLKKRFQELSKTAKKHKSGKDMNALRDALEGLAALYTEADGDADLQKKIVDAVGGVSKNKRNERVALEALYVLGQIRCPQCAKYVKSHLKQPDAAEVDDVLRAAIDVAGQIPDASLVAPLLKIVEKSKQFSCAASAMQALARYGTVEKKREKILATLIKTVKKDKPGKRPRNRSNNNESIDGSTNSLTNPYSVGANNRWVSLAPVLPDVLNQLTGQEEESAESWFDLYKSHKGKVGDLFIAEDE